mgnify:CR=1 FL=1
MEKYVELKKAIEEFLELRKNLNNRKDIKESHSLSLISYLVYGKISRFREDVKKDIEEEFRKWSQNLGKFDPLLDYYFVSVTSDEKDSEKNEEIRQINIKVGELTHKIKKLYLTIILA